MKKNILFTMVALLSTAVFAQTKYPANGLFKLTAIEAQGRTLKDLPQPTYRGCAGDRTLIFWVQPNPENLAYTQLTWRVELLSDENDPYSVKLNDVSSDSFLLSWYNASGRFYDFPSGIWINETWEKAKDEDVLNRISAAATNHRNKTKLQGTWKLVAIQAHDLPGEPSLPGKDTYKVYGEKDCLSFMGSLYNIEQGGRSYLRPFKWTSDNEFVEANVDHKVTFVNPNKMTLDFKDKKYGNMTETWIHYDIPEPLASLLSNFRE